MIRKGDDLTPIVIKVGIILILIVVIITAINPPGNPFDTFRYMELVERTGDCYNEMYGTLNDHELDIAHSELARMGIYCTRR